MARTEESPDTASRIIDSLRDAADPALEAMRKFLDTVDGIFPALSEDGPRRKIIDSAFKMTEQLVGTSTQLAQKILKATSDALAQPKKATARETAAKKAPARETAAKKAPARETAAKKAPARKTAAKKAPARKTAARKAPARKKA